MVTCSGKLGTVKKDAGRAQGSVNRCTAVGVDGRLHPLPGGQHGHAADGRAAARREDAADLDVLDDARRHAGLLDHGLHPTPSEGRNGSLE